MPGCDALVELIEAAFGELIAELEAQLDSAPPELDDVLPSAPLGSLKKTAPTSLCGPLEELPPPGLVGEVVVALELVAQLSELPLTSVWMFVWRMLDELLQL